MDGKEEIIPLASAGDKLLEQLIKAGQVSAPVEVVTTSREATQAPTEEHNSPNAGKGDKPGNGGETTIRSKGEPLNEQASESRVPEPGVEGTSPVGDSVASGPGKLRGDSSQADKESHKSVTPVVDLS